jgi:hypothetical protein
LDTARPAKSGNQAHFWYQADLASVLRPARQICAADVHLLVTPTSFQKAERWFRNQLKMNNRIDFSGFSAGSVGAGLDSLPWQRELAIRQ